MGGLPRVGAGAGSLCDTAARADSGPGLSFQAQALAVLGLFSESPVPSAPASPLRPHTLCGRTLLPPQSALWPLLYMPV